MPTPFGFDSAFLHRLDRLAIVSQRPVQGTFQGPRRSRLYGGSVEFADFRDYAPGDDLRRVDWNAYARLDRLFLRLFTAERMTILTLILDHSPSMTFGDPSKTLVAGRIAAVLSYLAMVNVDRVAVLGLGDRMEAPFYGRGGRAGVAAVWNRIETIITSPSGATDFAALRQYRAHRRGPGVTVVISDFLSDSDWRGGLRSLLGAGQEVALVQVLAPEELEPDLRGEWTLADVETTGRVETSITARTVRRYQEALAAHTAALQHMAARSRMTFARVRTDMPIETDVLRTLHDTGLVR